jgi:hypothetical protein
MLQQHMLLDVPLYTAGIVGSSQKRDSPHEIVFMQSSARDHHVVHTDDPPRTRVTRVAVSRPLSGDILRNLRSPLTISNGDDIGLNG